MNQEWQAIVALCSLATIIAGVIAIWWKVKTDSLALIKSVKDHDDKIMILITTKANVSDLIKLGEVVTKLETQIADHHRDAKMHRTEDFEKRMDDLIDSIRDYQAENRDEHKAITDEIHKLTKE